MTTEKQRRESDGGDQPAEPEKQPQPLGWWYAAANDETDILWVFEIPGLGLRWVDSTDATDSVDCGHVELIRHLPNCTGFDYEIPLEQTPAEKQLARAGLKYEGGERYSATSGDRTELLIITTEQADAMIAHKQEREGGTE